MEARPLPAKIFAISVVIIGPLAPADKPKGIINKNIIKYLKSKYCRLYNET